MASYLRLRRAHFVLVATLTLLIPVSFGQDSKPSEEAVARVHGVKEFSPYVGHSFSNRPLWGDQHVHTMLSVDAGTMCRLGQEDAYRFARGEEVTSTTGVRAKLSRPLDWRVISDHAAMYGLMPALLGGDPVILYTEQGKVGTPN